MENSSLKQVTEEIVRFMRGNYKLDEVEESIMN